MLRMRGIMKTRRIGGGIRWLTSSTSSREQQQHDDEFSNSSMPIGTLGNLWHVVEDGE